MQKVWAVLFGVVLALCFGLFVAAYFIPGWWLPHLANEGNWGKDVDNLFYFILWATTFFFVLTEVILVYAMFKFAGEPGRKASYTHGNHKLEIAWTIVPAAILLVIAFSQVQAWEKIKYQSRAPLPDQIIEVSARQFEWRMRYPTVKTRDDLVSNWKGDPTKANKLADRWGYDYLADFDDLHIGNEVHTWKGAQTRIYLKTRDVLHSFFLPNMRLKQDAVPGKTIPVWFQPTEANGEFKDGKWVYDKDEGGKEKVWELACAELCGWGHYKMQGHLYVHKDKASYEAWLQHALEKQNVRTREKK